MAFELDEVAADVFLCRGADVNWVVLRDGRDVTLIDTGYPGYLPDVERSVRRVGSAPEQIRAVLLTHAHVDHLGGARPLADTYGCPVYADEVEARHARREFLQQATPADVAKNLWRPGALPWLRRVLGAGALRPVAAPSAQPFPGVLDVPGHPVPVPTRGHTSGHTAYHLPAARAVVTGDELVTGHALLRGERPALLPGFFNHGDPRTALAPLRDLDAELILPGHGPAVRRRVRDAVDEAVRR